MIRTYVRKRPKHCYVDDAKERCRLCLEKCEESLTIFTPDSQISPLALRISICVGLELTKEECLSNVICKECFSEVERYYSFRKKCELTYQKLKSHIIAYNERNHTVNNKIKLTENNSGNLQNHQVKESPILPKHVPYIVQNNHVKEQAKEPICEKVVNEVCVDTSSKSEVPGKVTSTGVPFKSTEFSSFLSKMLLKLGVLSKEGNNLSISETSMSTVRLEMGDGSQMTLELMEEDNELEAQSLIRSMVTNESSPQMKLLTIEPLEVKESSETKDPFVYERSVSCPICKKVFSSRGVLNRHLRSHVGDKPHACPQCGRSFLTKSLLLRHELVHAENRPFSCAQCAKSFTQRQALENHVKQHETPATRPLTLYPCNQCDKLFMHRSGLTRHTRMHEGFIHVCHHCNRGFTDVSVYKRHSKTCAAKPTDPTADDGDEVSNNEV